MTLDSDGYLSEEDREAFWWTGYVETRAARKEGEWGFYRTPFYDGAHLPFVEDYG